uniref:Uncharacterized protein n=1 Tax=Caenorhabditis japonica TaxID=281687 RepID=A0A8R1DH10_CAEJA
MTVNAGNHGDVGVVVVDARTTQDSNVQSSTNAPATQSLVTALSSLRTSPSMIGSSPVAGRKRVHPGTNGQQFVVPPGNDVSPPHALVASLISRESSGGYMASPTKFTTARGDTTSFSKIFQKVEQQQQQQQQQHQNQHSQPTTSNNYAQMQPSFISTKPESTVKIIAPVPLKPQIIPLSVCNSIISPLATPRITPFRMLEEDSQSFVTNVLGQLTSNTDTLRKLEENKGKVA